MAEQLGHLLCSHGPELGSQHTSQASEKFVTLDLRATPHVHRHINSHTQLTLGTFSGSVY